MPGLEYSEYVPYKEVKPPPKKSCPRYGTKLHLLVKLQVVEIWEVLCTPSVLLFPGPIYGSNGSALKLFVLDRIVNMNVKYTRFPKFKA